MSRVSAFCLRLVPMLVVWALAFPCSAIEDRADVEPNPPAPEHGGIAWKFTPTLYRETAQRSSLDLNLRGNQGAHTAWIGQYQRGSEFQQTRLGYEYQADLPFGRVITSAQYATRGFFGGSITAEIGSRYFGLLGWGRTNLKPYYNLNFDPNDSVLVGGGVRPSSDTQLTVFQIRDDRLSTGQRVTHLVLRLKPGDRTRWTVDLFRKSGRSGDEGDTEVLSGTGATLTFDYEPWFARLAWDPKVNFTRSDMWRVAVGRRF